jgi:hypothetical protein
MKKTILIIISLILVLTSFIYADYSHILYDDFDDASFDWTIPAGQSWTETGSIAYANGFYFAYKSSPNNISFYDDSFIIDLYTKDATGTTNDWSAFAFDKSTASYVDTDYINYRTGCSGGKYLIECGGKYTCSGINALCNGDNAYHHHKLFYNSSDNNITIWRDGVYGGTTEVTGNFSSSKIKLIDRISGSTSAIDWINITKVTTTPTPSSGDLTITLNYPINNTIFYGDFLNKINVTLSNVNGTANCSIHNDNRWTVSGYDFGNETIIFINNTVITETNFTYQVDCYDIDNYYNLTGAWFIKYNVLNISIYDDITGDLINESVSMNLYNEDYYQTYETTNGTIYITGLNNGSYSADFSSDNYSNRGYTVTLGFGEITNLNAYLSSIDGEVILTTRDRETGAVIQGATITIKKFIDSVLTTIYTKDTDITGRIQFGYTTGVKYYFTVTKIGYDNKEFVLDPVIFSEYSIYLDSTAIITDDNDMAGVSIVHRPRIFYEGINNITVTISNPDGALLSYGFNYSYLGNTNSSSGSNAYGSTLEDIFNISGSSWGDKVRLIIYYRLNGETTKSYTYNYEIIPEPSNNTFMYNQNKHYGLGEFERVSIFTLMTLFIGGMFTIFTGAITGFGVMLLMMGYFVKIGFISLWYVVIPIFAGSIILIWRVSQ